jgi:hypothetical protein
LLGPVFHKKKEKDAKLRLQKEAKTNYYRLIESGNK